MNCSLTTFRFNDILLVLGAQCLFNKQLVRSVGVDSKFGLQNRSMQVHVRIRSVIPRLREIDKPGWSISLCQHPFRVVLSLL